MKLIDFIYEKSKFLDKETCRTWIDWFSLNPDLQRPGQVETGNTVDEIKRCLQIHPPRGDDRWYEMAFDCNKAIKEYYQFSQLTWQGELASYDHSIRKYDKGNGWFKEHIDISPSDPALMTRLYAMIIFLNNVDEGGETEFTYLNHRIKPEEGKLLLFPCNQLYPHQGNIPISHDKYVITSFFCPNLPIDDKMQNQLHNPHL